MHAFTILFLPVITNGKHEINFQISLHIDRIAKTIGVSVPTKATFFITYIMLDGWSAVAVELLRTKSLALYHLRTEKDREQAMEQENIGIPENLPRLQLYFLLGLVYAVVSPILLPFIIIFFILGFLVYRHQIINVYDPQYESVASFWPRVHESIMTSLITSHFHLIILLSTKKAPSTPLLTILLMLTIGFRNYCKKIFEPTFSKHPVEVSSQMNDCEVKFFLLNSIPLSVTADGDHILHLWFKAPDIETAKGTVELEAEPVLKLRPWLDGAYLHPIFRVVDDLMKREASSRRTEDSGSPVSAPITGAANDLGHQRDASSRRADCSPSPSPSISELSSPSPQYYGFRYV
ncbi:CSC1-like protein [Nymphaea thermarum]|nr:CSC1-like protein [Nymphaea thermarum]